MGGGKACSIGQPRGSRESYRPPGKTAASSASAALHGLRAAARRLDSTVRARQAGVAWSSETRGEGALGGGGSGKRVQAGARHCARPAHGCALALGRLSTRAGQRQRTNRKQAQGGRVFFWSERRKQVRW